MLLYHNLSKYLVDGFEDEPTLPHFVWTECPSAEYDKCLAVNFPHDNSHDIVLLNYVKEIQSVLEGHLQTEVESHVSVTVEGPILTVRMIQYVMHGKKAG